MKVKLDFNGVFGSKRSLTFEFPDKLGTVIKNPRDFFKNTDWENDESPWELLYPDALFIPNNGSKITGWYSKIISRHYQINTDSEGLAIPSFRETTRFTYIEDSTGRHLIDVWDEDGRTNELYEVETNYEPVPHGGLPGWTKHIDMKSERIVPVAEESNYQHVYCFDENMRYEQKSEAEWEPELREYIRETGGSDSAIWFEPEEVTYFIYGVPEYFTADADHYYAINDWPPQSEHDDDDYTQFHFENYSKKDAKPLGMCMFTSNKGEKFPLEVTKTYTANEEGGKRHTYQIFHFNQLLGSVNLYYEKYKCRGSSGWCEGHDLRKLTNHPNMNFNGCDFSFSRLNLAAIRIPSNAPGKAQVFQWVQTNEGKKLEIRNYQGWGNGNHEIELTINGMLPDIETHDGDKYIITDTARLRMFLGNIKIKSNLFNFSNEYSYLQHLGPTQWRSTRWLSSSSDFLPDVDGTLVVEPIFNCPICAYTDLITSHDHNGAMRREETDKKIRQTLIDTYRTENANDYFENIVGSWNSDPSMVRKELKKLKESKAKLKVLFIKAHGGKYDQESPKYFHSYSLMAKTGNQEQILDFDDIKYLLQGRMPDEYYIIVCNSCYGGGLVENFIHDDLNSPNFSDIQPDNSLGTNYMFVYADCANSPAWANNFNLYDFKQSESTYAEQVSEINNLVQGVRRENISELVELLKRQYNNLKSMLKLDKLKWTEKTYSDSINNAKNLLIMASFRSGDDYGNVVSSGQYEDIMTYPIIFLLYRVLGVLDSGSFFTWSSSCLPNIPDNISLSEFITDPNCFKTVSMKFVKNNPLLVTPKTKYLLQSENSISRIFEAGPMAQDDLDDLNRIAEFFYDCTKVWLKMIQNAKPLTNKIKRQYERYFEFRILSLFLDDNPGIILKGNWDGKKFPQFTGDESIMKITKQDKRKLEYKGSN